MKRLISHIIAVQLLVAPLFMAPSSLAASAAPIVRDKPLAALPYTPGLDVNAMDRTADPCQDFYQYVCGGWIKSNPIPPDQSRWDVYRKLGDDNQRYLWGILDSLAKKREGLSPDQEKIGAYFAACMNEESIETLGATPLAPLLEAIENLRSKEQLPELLAELHSKTGGSSIFFSFGSSQDFENSEKVIAFADVGGLGLPDRDYYVKNTPHYRDILLKYQDHIVRMLELLGSKSIVANQDARRIVAIEKALAKASLTRVQKRDPHSVDHSYDMKNLHALTPNFIWANYLKALGIDKIKEVNVTEPAFYKMLNKQWQSRSLQELKSYLRWQLLRTEAPRLSKAFVDENFAFYEKTLHGVATLPPRWKRCVDLVDSQLGEALGKEYVERNFSPKLKEKALHMTRQIETAMKGEIAALDWMSLATKKRAQEKLDTVVNKIGYPDKWRDYSRYIIRRDDFFGNVERGNQFESRRDLAKIGKPLDRGEWEMTPSTVNAYYNAQMNDINFPAGVLQPPLYDALMDAAPNYANTGGTIGHELTHGFDDEGRQFDARGNLSDWWTSKDAAEFNKRTQCIVDQYAQYTIVDDIKINSQLTLGEDVADLGGMVLAWQAWKSEIAEGTPAEKRDGFTPEQRFFISFGQWACENDRPENQRVSALTDPHSPGKYRINGVAVNMPEFAAAFGCKAGQAMVKEKRCRVW